MVHVRIRDGPCTYQGWSMYVSGMVHVCIRDGPCTYQGWSMYVSGMVHVRIRDGRTLLVPVLLNTPHTSQYVNTHTHTHTHTLTNVHTLILSSLLEFYNNLRLRLAFTIASIVGASLTNAAIQVCECVCTVCVDGVITIDECGNHYWWGWWSPLMRVNHYLWGVHHFGCSQRFPLHTCCQGTPHCLSIGVSLNQPTCASSSTKHVLCFVHCM